MDSVEDFKILSIGQTTSKRMMLKAVIDAQQRRFVRIAGWLLVEGRENFKKIGDLGSLFAGNHDDVLAQNDFFGVVASRFLDRFAHEAFGNPLDSDSPQDQ